LGDGKSKLGTRPSVDLIRPLISLPTATTSSRATPRPQERCLENSLRKVQAFKTLGDIRHDRNSSALDLAANAKVIAKNVRSRQLINLTNRLPRLLPAFQIFKCHSHESRIADSRQPVGRWPTRCSLLDTPSSQLRSSMSRFPGNFCPC